MKEFIFIWSVQNISYSWHKTRENIVSPKFYANPIQFSAWTLRLYPRGFENSDYLSLFLRRETDSAPENVAVNFELSCISADTSLVQTRFVPKTLKTFTKSEEHGFGELRFLRRHEVFGRRKALYLPQDTLTLRCRMWIDGVDNESGQIVGRTRLNTERVISDMKFNFKPENPMYNIVETISNIQKKILVSVTILTYEDKLDIGIYRINAKLMKVTTLNLTLVDKRTGTKLCEHKIVWFEGPQNEVLRLPLCSTLQYAENENSEENYEFIIEVIFSTGDTTSTVENDYQPEIPKFISNYIIGCIPNGDLSNFPCISQDLWKLYKDQILCDVELKTKDGSLVVHKVVLCARSSVFLAMLTDDMKEKINNCIEIEDISTETLETFIFFLYTDIFEDHEWDATAELYYAADKYQVERLRLLCSFRLMKNIKVDNVCDLLVLADRFRDWDLKRKIDDFIWENDETVFKSSLWKTFSTDHPHLAVKSMLSKYEVKENFSKTGLYKVWEHPEFLDDLKSLYQSKIVCDIDIKTKSTTLPAYKCVLCASSVIFKDMLLNDSRYKSAEFIEVEDLDDDIVSRMILYLNTSSFEDIKWDSALKLYRAAIKYQIQRLKFKCSYFMLQNLRVSNVCELLLLAHEHSDVELQSGVEDYIFTYDEEIFTSDEWAKFSETNLLLANKTICAKYKKKLLFEMIRINDFNF